MTEGRLRRSFVWKSFARRIGEFRVYHERAIFTPASPLYLLGDVIQSKPSPRSYALVASFHPLSLSHGALKILARQRLDRSSAQSAVYPPVPLEMEATAFPPMGEAIAHETPQLPFRLARRAFGLESSILRS